MHKGVNTTMDEGQTMVVQARTGGGFDVAHSLRADGFDASEDGTGRSTLVPIAFEDRRGRSGDLQSHDGIAGTLHAAKGQSEQQCVAFHENQRGELTVNDTAGSLKVGGGKPGQGYPAVAYDLRGREGGAMPEGPHDTANIRASSGGSSRSYVAASAVRRLTPRECERLQGFPDSWTAVPYRGKPAADGPRYKALGNSFAVPVVRWIGSRIAQVDKIP